MGALVISGTLMAREVRTKVAQSVAEMKAMHNLVPGLAAVLVGEDPPSVMYVGLKQKACREAGILSQVFTLPEEATQDELLQLIRQLNHDPRFHGILVQLPLPPQISLDEAIKAIDPAKDIEGLHPVNLGRLVLGDPLFLPCAAASIQRMILASGCDPEGKHAVICGNSIIVGTPTAILLMQNRPGANATVTICHEKTTNLAEMTRQADILVSAVGIPHLITADMVKNGAVVVDVGTNRIEDPTAERGYRVVGDVDFGPVSEKAAAITPVPGGVGPMTIAMLLANTLKAATLTIHPPYGSSLDVAE